MRPAGTIIVILPVAALGVVDYLSDTWIGTAMLAVLVASAYSSSAARSTRARPRRCALPCVRPECREDGRMSTRLVTAAELAGELGVPVDTIWRWARERRIPHFRLPGGQVRFDADEFRRDTRVDKVASPTEEAK
jgi:excisionase family DNA binding protein